MASYASNPYYDDPFLTQAASNIAKIFIDPNPGRTATQRAQARLYTLQGDELDTKARSRKGISGLFAARGSGGLTPEDQAHIAALAAEGGLKPDDYNGPNVYYASNTGQPDSVIARAIVGSNKPINKNEGVSLEDRNRIAQRDNDEAARRSAISAGPGYAAVAESRRYHDNELAFKDKTRFDKETNVPEGSAVFFAPGDPRFEGKADPGSIPAPRKDKDRFVVSPNGDGTFSYQQAAPGVAAPTPSSEKDKYVQSEDPKNPGKNIYTRAIEGTPGPAKEPKPEMKVSGKELDSMELGALQAVGAADSEWNVDPQFAEQFSAKRLQAKQAMADAFQSGRNPAEAQGVYYKTLGIQPGSKWNAPSMIGRALGGQPGFKAPGGAAPPTAAPAVATPVPPPAAREPGKIYRLPKGAFMWTPDGWVAAPRADDGVR
jgi:hypothetical protein